MMMSAAERRFLVDGVAQDVRTDGRASGTFRRVVAETGVFDSCAGSARVRVGLADVAVGVKLRVAAPKSDAPTQGFLECSVESAKSLVVDDADLAQALFRAYSQGRCLDLDSLCIAPHLLCWCVHVDAIVHSSDGNLLDVLSIAARAALHNTRVPAVRAVGTGAELELDVDSDVAAGAPLDVSRVPICVTLTRIGALHQHFVVDATREELLCASGSVAVAVNARGRTCALEKRGLPSIDPATLFTMLHTARSVAALLIAAVDRLLADGAQMRADSRGFMN